MLRDYPLFTDMNPPLLGYHILLTFFPRIWLQHMTKDWIIAEKAVGPSCGTGENKAGDQVMPIRSTSWHLQSTTREPLQTSGEESE